MNSEPSLPPRQITVAEADDKALLSRRARLLEAIDGVIKQTVYLGTQVGRLNKVARDLKSEVELTSRR